MDDVVREIRVEASPEVVYGYFTEPELMTRWFGVSAKLEPQPGGLFRVEIDDHNIARGTYIELTPHERVVFTWGWEGEGREVPPGSTTVEVTFTPEGDATLVRLRHSGLPDGTIDKHGDGWGHYLGRLGVAAAGDDAGVDTRAG